MCALSLPIWLQSGYHWTSGGTWRSSLLYHGCGWRGAVSMMFMPFCYAEAAANLLTNPALDPMGKIPEFKFCAARVSALVSEPVAAK